MSNAAATYLTDAERADRQALLRSLGVKPPKPAQVGALDGCRPLGLRPVLDGDDAEPEARATTRLPTPGVYAQHDDLMEAMALITEFADTINTDVA
jgi:hypothetical protein